MPIDMLLYFFLLTLVLDLSPGPTVALVSSATLSKGVKQGILASLGCIAGDNIWAFVALLAIFLSYNISTVLMDGITYLGALYLIYLGASSFKKMPDIAAFLTGKAPKAKDFDKKPYFMSGVLIQIANPKSYLYYLAILPQFQPETGPTLLHNLILIAIITLSTVLALGMYITGFYIAKKKLVNKNLQEKLDHVSGVAMMGIGIWMLLKHTSVL